MKKLEDQEVDEIIDLAYQTAESYILKNVSKKDFENINITINLQAHEDSFDIDINIDLDSDFKLPDDLSENAVNLSLDAVDDYVAKRKLRLGED